MNLLEEVQQEVVARLSADPELSACPFVAENSKDVDFEIKRALGKQGIIGLVMTPKATFAGKYEDLFMAWQLDRLEIDVVENVPVNRGKKDGYVTGQDAAMRLMETLCPLYGGDEGRFQPVSVEQGEDRGLLVNKCVLKALVLGDESPEPPQPGIGMHFVRLLDQPPPAGVQPKDGWMWLDGDQWKVRLSGTTQDLGVSRQEVSEVSAALSSEIGLRRDYQDLGVYGDPVGQTSSTTFTASWGYAGGEEPVGQPMKLEWTGGEGKQWKWSDGNRSLYVDLSPQGDWTVSYRNFEDPGGYLHDGNIHAPLKAPKWACRVQDDWFWFSVTTKNTDLATDADLSAYATKQYVDGLMGDLSSVIRGM